MPEPASPYTVRDAVNDDIHRISAIMPDAFGLLGGRPWLDRAYVAEGIASCAANLSAKQRLKVALDGGLVVGCSFHGLAINATDAGRAHTEIGVIHGIAVDRSRRRCGVGTALLDASERELRAEGARLMVAEVRPKAERFFANHRYAGSAHTPALVVASSSGPYTMVRSTMVTVLMWRNLDERELTASDIADGILLRHARS